MCKDVNNLDMGRETKFVMLFALVVGVTVVGIVGFSFISSNSNQSPDPNAQLEQFNTSEDFKSFIESDSRRYLFAQPTVQFETANAGDDRTGSSGSYEKRQTNTQVEGIDEPDIVKLTDDAAYYSPNPIRYFLPIIEPNTDVAPYQHSYPSNTLVFDTVNTDRPEVISEINQSGKMLREGDRMVIYNRNKIVSYDVSDGENPTEVWEKKIPEDSEVESARSADGQLYFVIKSYTKNCPVNPVSSVDIDCNKIYHPVQLKSGESVYSVLSIEMDSGELNSETSIVGSYGSSFYMSEDNMYISYQTTDLNVENFVKQNIDKFELTESEKTELLDKIDNKSVESMYELERVIADIIKKDSVRKDSNDRIHEKELDVNKLYREYVERNQRNISRTVIVRLSVDNGEVSPKATGSVPGHPLNQYSFNEYNDNLRIATTVQGAGEAESLNDMYVLNQNLEIEGSVQDMAEGQRVYSVRFIGEKGYIITFRQIDPLHVIDIQDPENPEEVGVLELPGFSDYLHKVGENEILGIGQSSDRKGKVVLFDVSDDENPKVADSVIFEQEFQTEVSENFRSFLKDDEKGVVYIPANNGVHVLKHKTGEIEEVEMIETNGSASRVRILGDDLFVFHSNGVLSVDRDSYKVNGELTFEEYKQQKDESVTND